jgi:hypothetical protein
MNMFEETEKLLKYRYWDKERERSNRAAALRESAVGTRRRCPLRHDMLAWSGPPHDTVRAYICLRCNAAASEPEIRDRGFTFEEIPDWEIMAILDLDLERMGADSKFYSGIGEGFERDETGPAAGTLG